MLKKGGPVMALNITLSMTPGGTNVPSAGHRDSYRESGRALETENLAMTRQGKAKADAR
jgi:hypothetical protein